MQNKKAQFSLEYMFVIAFAMTAVLITVYVFFIQSQETSEEQQLATVDIIARDLLSNAKNVYYSGDLSKKTLRYTMPAIVNNIIVYEEEDSLVFNVTSQGATYDLTYYSDVPIEGYFPESKQYTEQIAHFIVYNRDDHVSICTEEFAIVGSDCGDE